MTEKIPTIIPNSLSSFIDFFLLWCYSFREELVGFISSTELFPISWTVLPEAVLLLFAYITINHIFVKDVSVLLASLLLLNPTDRRVVCLESAFIPDHPGRLADDLGDLID